MMPAVPTPYVGREQAYIKHVFLRSYLEQLVHKIASFAECVVYVDGFSGPWKSATEDYADTSFGIALKALTDARRSWLTMPSTKRRSVAMEARLVEEDAAAFSQLRQIGEHFPEIAVKPYKDDFIQIASEIADTIPANAFSFVFVDPKGFALDLARLGPLIRRNRCEVVFNFMFDYANRFPSLPQLGPTFDRLFPGVDWRSEFTRLESEPATTSEQRKRAFLGWFKQAVRNVGGYRYVADVEIQYPGRDRTFYFLVYGTRKSPGIKVFRDCQIKAEEEQTSISSQIRVGVAQAGGQLKLPGLTAQVRSAQFQAKLAHEAEAAQKMLLSMIPETESVRWDAVWPNVLAEHVVSEGALGRIANDLRRRDVLAIPNWSGARRQKPEDAHLLQRGTAFSLV